MHHQSLTIFFIWSKCIIKKIFNEDFLIFREKFLAYQHNPDGKDLGHISAATAIARRKAMNLTLDKNFH